MPENLTMGFFGFGAILILISLLGGGFNIFSIGVSTTISNPVIRVTAFILGIGFILLALNPAVISNALGNATNTPSPVSIGDYQITPQPTQTSSPTVPPSLSPTVVTETPAPLRPDATNFVISYWQNVSDGRYETAWAQLSPGFQQDNHNNDYSDYVFGYQQMNLCRIVVSDINLIRQDNYSAIVTAHLTYHSGPQCRSSEYDFEMGLVYDNVVNSWLFDKNVNR